MATAQPDAQSLYRKGLQCADRGDLVDALACFRESLKGFEADADERGQAAVLYQLGLIQVHYGDAPGALRFYRRSLVIYERLSTEGGPAIMSDQRGVADDPPAVADVALQTGDTSLAGTHGQRLPMAGGSAFSAERGIADNLHAMAGLALDSDDEAQARSLYQQALALRERLGDARDLAATLHQLAVLAGRRGNSEEALALYQRSLLLNSAINNDPGCAATLYRIAGMHAGLEDWAASAAFFLQAASCYERTGNVERTAHCRERLAAAAFSHGDAALALACGQQAVRDYAAIDHWHQMVGPLADLSVYQPELRLSWLAQAAWLACAMSGLSRDGFAVITSISRQLPAGSDLELTIAALTVLRLEREAPGRQLSQSEPARALLELAAGNHSLEDDALEAWLAQRRADFGVLYRQVLDQLAYLVHTEWLFDRNAVPQAR